MIIRLFGSALALDVVVMRRHLAALAVAGVILDACGGGGTTAPAPVMPSASAVASQETRDQAMARLAT
jgi:hypothetical protein